MSTESQAPKVKRPRKGPTAAENPRPQNPTLAVQTLVLNASFEAGAPGPRLAPRPAVVAIDPDQEQVRLPPVTEVRGLNTSRLLPSKYSESVLTRIAESDADLQLIYALDNATNDRLAAEANQRLGITARELVFEVPYWRIINAAFTHPHPQGARFSMPYRGAWYAGLELATAKAEVLFHRSVQFAEIDWQQREELDYDQYTADFTGAFHDLRPAAFAREDAALPSYITPQTSSLHPFSLEPNGGEPTLNGGSHETNTIPASATIRASAAPPTAAEFAPCLALSSYIASQQLAIHLLEAGSLGILYPSARRVGGNCIACFRPSVITNVRKRELYRLCWYPDRAATFVRVPRALPTTGLPA